MAFRIDIRALLGAAALGLVSTYVRAEDRWLFVPVYEAEEGEPPAAALTRPWEAAFAAASVTNADGAKLLEAQSSEPRQLTDEQLERYTEDLDNALRHLAGGERAKGERKLRAVRELGGKERNYLRRAPERAQKLFDACVYTSYLLAREKQQGEAMQRMGDCLRSFPGFQSPSRAPELRALIDQAREKLEREPHGDLTITSAARDGCLVRLNGLPVGTTPATIAGVPVGPASIQVECDAEATGRLHTVEIPPHLIAVTIDPRFDAAVSSRAGDSLTLRFADASTRVQFAASAAAELGRMLNITRVVPLLINAGADGQLKVTPLPVGVAASLPSVMFGHGTYDPNALRQAILQLRAALPDQPPAPPPQMLAASTQPPEPEDDLQIPNIAFRDPDPASPHPSNAPVFIAAGMSIVGMAAVATGWVMFLNSQDYRLHVGEGVEAHERDTFASQRTWSLTTTSVGAALLTGAEFVWLPRTHSIPTWAWIAGGLGVASLATGVALAVAGTHCGLLPSDATHPLDRACQQRTSDAVFGWTLAITSVPLLTLPLAFWQKTKPVEVTLTGLGLSAHGVF